MWSDPTGVCGFWNGRCRAFGCGDGMWAKVFRSCSRLAYSSSEIVTLCPTVIRWMLISNDDWKHGEVGWQMFWFLRVLQSMMRFSKEGIARECVVVS